MYELTTATSNTNYWLIPVVIRKEVTPQAIIDAGCQAFNIDKSQLLSKSRKKELVRARFIIMAVMKMKLKLTLQQMASHFKKKDHTTVLHALQRIENDLSITAYRQETNDQIRSVTDLL